MSSFVAPGIWASTLKLLRLRAVILWNEFRRARLRRKIGLIVAALGIAVFLGFIVFLSIMILDALRSPYLSGYVGDTAPLLDSFPTLLISGATLGLLITSFGVMLQALYLSGDMDFLMSAPIPVRAIFIAKLIQGILPNFAIMCLFSLPLLFGLGISGHYNLFYYPLTVILLAALTLAAAGLASLLVLVAARYFPARRLAEVVGFVAGTSVFLFSQTSRFINYDVSGRDLSRMLAVVQRFNRPWSPLTWAGNGLVLFGQGNLLPGLGLITAALLVSIGIFYAAMVTAERLYYTGWSSLQNNRRSKARNGRKAAAAASAPAAQNGTIPPAVPVIGGTIPARPNLLVRWIPAPVRAIIAKDLLLYRRDLRNLSRMITPLILAVVYAVSLVQSGGHVPAGEEDAPVWLVTSINTLLPYADVALALFMGWMLAANLAGQGFSMEGRRYWMLKAAPLNSRTLLTAKFLVSYLPELVLCGLYILVLQFFRGVNPWSLLVSLLAVAAILAGVNGIYLSFGVLGARFDWDNPNETGRTVGCLGTLVGMLYVPVSFIFFAGPTLAAGLLQFPLWAGQAVGLVLGIALGLLAAILPLWLVEKRVATLMES